MLYQGIKGQLNRDASIKDNDFPTCSQHREAIVPVKKGRYSLSSCPPDNLTLILKHLELYYFFVAVAPKVPLKLLLMNQAVSDYYLNKFSLGYLLGFFLCRLVFQLVSAVSSWRCIYDHRLLRLLALDVGAAMITTGRYRQQWSCSGMVRWHMMTTNSWTESGDS